MLYRTSAILTSGLLSLAWFAQADTWDKKTVLTVNEPIQVPGKVLQPGKYVIKLVDSLGHRHIVRILNEREDEVMTTILAIPNYRLEPTGDTAFQWWETPAGNPRALRAWFYPGDNFGQEFAYPKGMSAQIASYATAPVPTTHAETEAQLREEPVTVTEKSGEEKPLPTTVYTLPTPLVPPLVAQAAPPEPEPAPVAAVAPAPEPVPLPATGSPFPLIALAGLVSIAAGIGVRTLASRGR